MRIQILIIPITASMLAGCANLTHLTRTKPLGDGKATFIDAKQRGIFTANGVTCAEPSPDALSALAASGNLNVGTSKGTDVSSGFSFAEAAGAIGLRTQSIQLMRDHMFRICEAYQNHAISPLTYALFHRRFQTTVVSILAIEQLTGTVRAPAIVLEGNSSSGNADAIAKLSATRESQAGLVDAAQVDVAAKTKAATASAAETAAAQKIFDTAAPDAKAAAEKTLNEKKDKSTSDTSALASSQGTLSSRKLALEATDNALKKASTSGTAGSSGTIETVASAASIGEVSATVKAIVDKTLDLKNEGDFCVFLLSEAVSLGTNIDKQSEVFTSCRKKQDDGTLRVPT